MFDLNADWSAIVETSQKRPRLIAQEWKPIPGSAYQAAGTASNLPCAPFSDNRSLLKVRRPWLAVWQAALANPFAGQRVSLIFFLPRKFSLSAPLGEIGLTTARAETIRALARAVCNGKHPL